MGGGSSSSKSVGNNQRSKEDAISFFFNGRVGALDLSLQHILRRVGSNSYLVILHKGGTC